MACPRPHPSPLLALPKDMKCLLGPSHPAPHLSTDGHQPVVLPAPEWVVERQRAGPLGLSGAAFWAMVWADTCEPGVGLPAFRLGPSLGVSPAACCRLPPQLPPSLALAFLA